MKNEPSKFFTWYLLITLLTVIILGIGLSLFGRSAFLDIVSFATIVINVFVVLFLDVLAITFFIQHIKDKKKKKFQYFHIVNVLFALVVTAMLMLFYLNVVAGMMLYLLPFFA